MVDEGVPYLTAFMECTTINELCRCCPTMSSFQIVEANNVIISEVEKMLVTAGVWGIGEIRLDPLLKSICDWSSG